VPQAHGGSFFKLIFPYLRYLGAKSILLLYFLIFAQPQLGNYTSYKNAEDAVISKKSVFAQTLSANIFALNGDN
jgi:hypothetical protein